MVELMAEPMGYTMDYASPRDCPWAHGIYCLVCNYDDDTKV